MSPHTFPTSPARSGEQRKFINPTTGYVGANVFGPDGKPTAVAVEPGGEVWLTPEEERMTAEAPRHAQDNPFVREWDEPVGWDQVTGEAVQTVRREGVLVLADEPARPIASDRFIPAREEPVAELSNTATEPAVEEEAEAADEPEEELEIAGTNVTPEQQGDTVEGTESEGELVGTPEARDRAKSGAIPS